VTYSRFGASDSFLQTVHTQAGEVISGWANFESGDGGGGGQASVLINGQEVWFAIDRQFGLPGRFLGWQHWSYTVPQDGDFTISLDMTGSGTFPSFGAFFDDITVSAVPEQATFMVGAFPLLLVGLDAVRRTLKRSTSQRLKSPSLPA